MQQQQQQGHYAANTHTHSSTYKREREGARQIGLTASDGAFLTMRPQHQQQQQEQLHQQQYQQLQLGKRWRGTGGGAVRAWGLPKTRYNKWKFQEYSHSLWVLAFAAASRCLLGFPGLFTACKFFALLFLSLFFFYFLAIFVFFVVIVFVHCWLVAKREICVAKLHIFIVITRC